MSETPDMVERVARALCIHGGFDPDSLEPGDAYGIDGTMPNGDPAHLFWRQFEAEARAAIEAMREMTDAMVAAAWESRMADVQGQWSDVIDEALTTSSTA